MDGAGGLYALKKILRADIGFFEKDFMFRAGQEGAREYLSAMKKAVDGMEPRAAFEKMLEFYSDQGYGVFKLTRFDAEKKIVEISSPNAIEAWAFQVNNDLQRESVCSYTSGVLALICKLTFTDSEDLDFRTVETECAAQGMNECRFVVAPIEELPKIVPRYELPNESISEHVLRLNEEILMKNLELQSLNLSLERQVRKRTGELQRSVENYRNLINLSPDPILICTPEGAISSINEAGVKMLGYQTAEEAMSATIQSILPDKGHGWEKLSWLLEKEGVVHQLELDFLRKSGSRLTGELSARYADLPTGRCIELVVRDVSERRAMQAQMDEARTESDFLNDLLSHDIINYTTAAMHFAENLRKSPNLSDEDMRQLSIIVKNMHGAYELSASVRDLSRIKSITDKEYEVKNLNYLLAEAIEDAKRMFSERNVTVNIEKAQEPRYVRANMLVSRALLNVLTNAIKFNPNESVLIDISIDSCVEDGRAYWRTRISDYGVGIPDEEKEQIFNKFHRITPSIPGTGLGMFAARFIIDACKGKISAEDRVKGDHRKGTTFVVMLLKADLREVATAPKMLPGKQ